MNEEMNNVEVEIEDIETTGEQLDTVASEGSAVGAVILVVGLTALAAVGLYKVGKKAIKWWNGRKASDVEVEIDEPEQDQDENEEN